MRWLALAPFVALLPLSIAEPQTFDLGDLDQYKSKQQNPPSLTGSSIWISGTEEKGGFDIGVSPDVKAKIHGVLEGCGKLDDKCYQDTRAVLESVNVEIDQKLERRAFRDMLSKTAKKSLWVFFDIWNYLTMSWYQKSQDLNGADSFLFIPVSKANEAANLRTAQDIVISAGGGAVATITQKPSSTGIKGTHAPSITAVTTPQDNGVSPGDLMVYMDQNLASRMQEIMMRNTQCEDGAKFDREHPSKRRAASNLGRAICAYHAVIVNMGGALSDLMQTNLGGLDFAIPTTPAAELTLELLEDYAPIIDLQVDRARALAAYLFALAVGVVIDGRTLGPTNKIPSTLIQTNNPTAKPTQTTASPSSSSSSGCPDPTKTPLFCAQENQKDNDCEVAKAKENGPRCEEKGKYANCECNMPTDMIVHYTSKEELAAMQKFMELFKTVKVPEPKPEPKPEPPKPKGPTKALTIIADYITDYTPDSFTQIYKIYWKFFGTDYGKAVDCRNDPAWTEEMPRSFKEMNFPGGTFPLELFGEKCTYRNSGDNVGKLFCGDKVIECFWDPLNKDPTNSGKGETVSYVCEKNWQREKIFTCPY